MKKLALLATLGAAAALWATACGPTITPQNTAPTDGGTATDDGGTAACTSADVASTPCTTHSDCDFSGKCEAGKALCNKTTKKCTSEAIYYAKVEDLAPSALDLSCYGKAPSLSATPATVTVSGCLVPFGVDASTTGIVVSLFDPQSLTAPIATFTTVAGSTLTPPIVCSDDKYGAFRFTNIATAKRFVAKAVGDAKFHATYRFNVAYDGADAVSGVISGKHAEINIISETTWGTIPPLLGLSSGITKGNAAVAGAIQDCAGNAIANAQVVIDPKPVGTRFGYFNTVVDDPKPSLSRHATNLNGLYTAINMPPQTFTVKASVVQNGQTIDLGSYAGASFADSVTILSITRPLP